MAVSLLAGYDIPVLAEESVQTERNVSTKNDGSKDDGVISGTITTKYATPSDGTKVVAREVNNESTGADLKRYETSTDLGKSPTASSNK